MTTDEQSTLYEDEELRLTLLCLLTKLCRMGDTPSSVPINLRLYMFGFFCLSVCDQKMSGFLSRISSRGDKRLEIAM